MKARYEFLHKNEIRHVQVIPSDQLNAYICQSFVLVTKMNGEEYKPTRLRSFVSSVDRQGMSLGYKISEYMDYMNSLVTHIPCNIYILYFFRQAETKPYLHRCIHIIHGTSMEKINNYVQY